MESASHRTPYLNRFAWPFQLGGLYGRIPKDHVDRKTHQAVKRLGNGRAFQGVVREIRRKWGEKTSVGWLVPRLVEHRKQYEVPLRRARRKMERYLLRKYKVIKKGLPPAVEALRYHEARERFGVYALERECDESLRDIKREMTALLPERELTNLLRRFQLPDIDFWKDAVEWLVHEGDIVVKKVKGNPYPNCHFTVVKRRLCIRFYRSTQPGDIEELFRRPYDPKEPVSEKMRWVRLWDRFTKQREQRLMKKHHIRGQPVFESPLSGKPEVFAIGTGDDLAGYIWLPRRFSRDDILVDLWPRFCELRDTLPGGEALRLHPKQESYERAEKEAAKVVASTYHKPKAGMLGAWGKPLVKVKKRKGYKSEAKRKGASRLKK